MNVLKTSRVVYVFHSSFMHHRNKFSVSTHQIWLANINDRVKQIFLELKVWMSSFPNIRIRILQNLLKNIRDAVFNLTTFQTKGL